ncbi:phosphoethanolamine transferase domain-containing protein [Pedobacter sp. NJ-S-72]
MLKNSLKLSGFVLLMSFLNFLLFHFPFFTFVFHNLDYKSFSGITIIISLIILMLILNAFVFYLIFFLSRIVGKSLLVLFFMINSIAVYFINTYSVIIDESMIGNIFNTNYQESSSFFSLKLVLYIILLGIIPSIYIIKVKIINVTLKRFLTTSSLTLVLIAILIFANATNWLWIDKKILKH